MGRGDIEMVYNRNSSGKGRMGRRDGMTVCIAAACEGSRNVVVGADRMLTIGTLSLEFQHPNPKIVPLSDSCVMMTAGPALRDIELQKYVRRALAGVLGVAVPVIVDKVKEGYQEARRGKIEELYLKPRGLTLDRFLQAGQALIQDAAMVIDEQLATYDYELDVLVAGVDADGAHIYEIVNPGTAECFDSIGYHAIGSGSPHAASSFIEEGYSSYSATLQQAMWSVFQAKKRAERAPGVGEVAVFAVIEQGRLLKFPANALSKLGELYEEVLKGREECLRRLMPQLASVPKPEERL